MSAPRAPRPFERVFAEPPFAFDEVGLLVRSLPLRAARGARARRRGRAWRVRFADPAIVTSCLVDERSRRIVAQEVVQRRIGMRMRYVEAP